MIFEGRMQATPQVPYDLTGSRIYALAINNTYVDSALPTLSNRMHNENLMTKRLADCQPSELEVWSNLTSKAIKEVVSKFLCRVKAAAKNEGPVVTLFYFSGYGTTRDGDREQSILCGIDYERSARHQPFRLLFDYMALLHDLPGMHMLLLDCDSLEKHFDFTVPPLPASFHVFSTTHAHLDDPLTLTSALTRTWCKYTQVPGSLEEVCKRVRIELTQSYGPAIVNECSTLLNHFCFTSVPKNM